MDATIIWDLEDDPDGNVQHIREHGGEQSTKSLAELREYLATLEA